jgi:hypothetical protein
MVSRIKARLLEPSQGSQKGAKEMPKDNQPTGTQKKKGES